MLVYFIHEVWYIVSTTYLVFNYVMPLNKNPIIALSSQRDYKCIREQNFYSSFNILHIINTYFFIWGHILSYPLITKYSSLLLESYRKTSIILHNWSRVVLEKKKTKIVLLTYCNITLECNKCRGSYLKEKVIKLDFKYRISMVLTDSKK